MTGELFLSIGMRLGKPDDWCEWEVAEQDAFACIADHGVLRQPVKIPPRARVLRTFCGEGAKLRA